MNYYYSTILIVACALLNSVSWSQQTNETMTIGTTSRNYIKYLPTGLDIQNEEVSLVVVLHGLGDVNTTMAAGGFNNIADTARIIVLYPQGAQNMFGQNSWNNGTLLSSTVDDIGFMNALVTSMITTYNVDPTRVYFTGFSMGSIMSYHVACAMNDRVAAIGCMAGTMATSDIESCVPAYATPVIHLHGTADGTVPYNANALPSLSLVPETMNFWKNVHSCDATADSLRITDSASDNITVDRFRYDACDPAGSLELWRLNGADHVYLSKPMNDITEMIEVWLFMRRWSHAAPAMVGLTENGEHYLSIAPNPSEGLFTIESSGNELYTITTMNGATVLSGELQAGKNAVDLAGQANGLYLLNVGTTVYKLVKN